VKREIVLLIGRVQGVGFRYQVLRIAHRFAVTGSVRNLRTNQALEIDVEGEPEEIERFLQTVFAHPPPGGRIDTATRREAQVRGAASFEITATEE
jgi:hydrogenase maturation factor HypF (carbamoyltransferase family)